MAIVKLDIHIHNIDNQKLDKIMASQEQFQAQLDRIAAAIAKLQANQGGLTAAQEDADLSILTTQADQLEALANPAPPQQ